MKKNYWNESGKYQSEVERISNLKPSWGRTDNAYMNLYLVATNLYYDVYNNGGCNIKDCYAKDIDTYVKPFANEIKAINFDVTLNTIYRNLKNEEKLERFIDEVIEFISDKDLSYTKYAVYVDFKNEKVSYTEREGFEEMSFGEEDEYKSWTDHRINQFKYELVQ